FEHLLYGSFQRGRSGAPGQGREKNEGAYAMSADPIVIVGAKRTPMGGFQGELSGLRAADLGAAAIRAAVAEAGVAGEDIEQGVMGCVLQAAQGQAPARQAVRYAGLPDS